MSKQTQRKKLDALKTSAIKAYGPRSASFGSEHGALNAVSTGSLMLDYKLGTGGIIYGGMVEVFGSNGLGKSSALLYGTLANVQKEEKLAALIAMEPIFDKKWATKLGLDPDFLLVLRPENAQEAFDMLRDLVFNTAVDFIGIDSLGAMGNESSQKAGGKAKAYGISAETTSALNDIMPRLYKADKALMVINQQRQAGSANGNTFYESPGGEALKHAAWVRIQVKPGSKKYFIKLDGEEALAGRELKCTFKKPSKVSHLLGKSAEFDFYTIQHPDYENLIGIDVVGDYVKVAKVTGVFKSQGSWLEHPVFPKGKIQGVAKARKFFAKEPEAMEAVRNDVMSVMVQQELEAQEKSGPPGQEVEDDGESGDE
jgi:recombination protein RecA